MKKDNIVTNENILCKSLVLVTIYLICMIVLGSPSIAQQRVTRNPPAIGTLIPDSVLNSEIKILKNYKEKTARLSDFKGKYIILDFWATWCGSCIKSFPNADRIYKSNQKNLALLLINTSLRDKDEAQVKTFLDSFIISNKTFSVPVFGQSEVFRNYFPSHSLPYYIWIGKDNKIKGISGYKSLNDENVSNFLSGKPLIFSQ